VFSHLRAATAVPAERGLSSPDLHASHMEARHRPISTSPVSAASGVTEKKC
jgi:hypothetical protein